jgi:hypothetical protein
MVIVLHRSAILTITTLCHKMVSMAARSRFQCGREKSVWPRRVEAHLQRLRRARRTPLFVSVRLTCPHARTKMLNPFRLLADLSHVLAIVLLLLKILKTKSVAGT